MQIEQRPSKHTIAIIGAGPAGLFAAEYLAQKNYNIHLFDQMAKPGRKLLMAGKSGLNLTHNEDLEIFLSRYNEARPFLEASIRNFPPSALQNWAENLGEKCFIGTSGRVFLKNFKASPLLRAWLTRLSKYDVHFYPKYRLNALNKNKIYFSTPHGEHIFTSSATLLALGGASWKRLGSDGKWAKLFPKECTAFKASNCGFIPHHFEDLLARHEGSILHDVMISFQNHTQRGGLILTKKGFEGTPLYALSPFIREEILQNGSASISLNLRPSLSNLAIEQRLNAQRPRESRANKLRKSLKLDSLSRDLLNLFSPQAQNSHELTSAITQLPIKLTAPSPLDSAISTAGGLKWDSLENFMLKNHPGIFACGEMLDWEAPTGGYLLQACFATALHAAQSIDSNLSHTSDLS